MDILRLPTALRHAVLSHRYGAGILRRHLTTSFAPINSPPSPSPLQSSFNLEDEGSDLLTLRPDTLNSYNVALPPERPNLQTARSFFTRKSPTLLYSASQYHSFPPSHFPEVAFLGRSNVGKSSLLNALFGRPHEKVARVSSRPGRTRSMNGFGIGGQGIIGEKSRDGEDLNKAAWKRYGRGGLVVVDMPGYGSGSRAEWGQAAMMYLQQRTQLRRSFVLIDTEHGLKRSDVELLTFLHTHGVPYQIVMSKVDKLLFPKTKAPGAQSLHKRLVALQKECEGVRKTLNEEFAQVRTDRGKPSQTRFDILCCSAEKSLGGNRRIGIDELRWAVLSACGLESSEF